MQLKIAGDSSLKFIQQEFSRRYPFLKIEFLRSGAGLSSRHATIAEDQLDKIFPADGSLKLPISTKTTVAELEDYFEDLLKLSIQVFRKAGTVWVETSLTEDWTLAQQNEEGRLFSTLPLTKKAGSSASPRLK